MMKHSKLTNPIHGSQGAMEKPPKDRPLRWLLYPKRRTFLLPATGLWILALDWLLFSSNMLTAGLGTPVIALIGFFVGGTGAFFVERRFGGSSALKACLKALLAGIAVGIPWPLAGTLTGGTVLLLSGLGKAKKE